MHVSLIGDVVRMDLRCELLVVNQSGLPLQYRSGNHEQWKRWQHVSDSVASPVVPSLGTTVDTKPRLIGYIGSKYLSRESQSGVDFFPKPRRGSVGRSSSIRPPINKMAIRVMGTHFWSPPFNVHQAGSYEYINVTLPSSKGEKTISTLFHRSCISALGLISTLSALGGGVA